MTNNIMMQAFEWYLPSDGSYYKKLKEKASELKKSGIDALWLPPMFKGSNSKDVGYGVYDLYDLGEFNQKGTVRTKYGTLDELRDLISELHKNDIKVYADIVINHKSSADYTENIMVQQVDIEDRNKNIGQPREIKGWTGFNFDGRNNKYSNFKWNHTHFSGVDYDQLTGDKGVFLILKGQDDGGAGWAWGVSDEKGNYDYLMYADIDFNNEEVRNEIFSWFDWFINFVDIDGIRFDALKHIDDSFILSFIEHIKSVTKDDFYLFGEYWDGSLDENEEYMYETKYNIDLFDVGLHFNMEACSRDGENYDIRKIFDGSLVKQNPAMAVTFVDNHDSQPGQALESFIEPWFKKIGYGLILLRKDGYPCIFYGDYYGLGTESGERIEGQKEVIDNLMDIRKKYAYGEQIDFFNDPHLIGWIRKGDKDHKESLAVVISTGDMNTLVMNVGEDKKGKIFVEITGENENEIVIDENGNGNFEVGPGSLSCWVEKK